MDPTLKCFKLIYPATAFPTFAFGYLNQCTGAPWSSATQVMPYKFLIGQKAAIGSAG